MSRTELLQQTSRETLEYIIEKSDDASLYGVLAGLTAYASYVSKPHTGQPLAPDTKPPMMPGQGGQYI